MREVTLYIHDSDDVIRVGTRRQYYMKYFQNYILLWLCLRLSKAIILVIAYYRAAPDFHRSFRHSSKTWYGVNYMSSVKSKLLAYAKQLERRTMSYSSFVFPSQTMDNERSTLIASSLIYFRGLVFYTDRETGANVDIFTRKNF